MIQWNDTVRDYINRKNKARDYLQRAQASKDEREEKLMGRMVYLLVGGSTLVWIYLLLNAFSAWLNS